VATGKGAILYSALKEEEEISVFKGGRAAKIFGQKIIHWSDRN